MPRPDFRWISLEERFRLSFSKGEGCWEWQRARDRDGYGVIRGADGKQLRAHRLSYKLLVGEFDEALMVLHRCDNRCCVRPDHLFLGTGLDNALDMVSKGRNADQNGEKSHRAVLTESQVLEIRRRYRPRGGKNSAASLAREFGVSPSQIGKIIMGKRWKKSLQKDDPDRKSGFDVSDLLTA